jgi:hypothetical protein
MLDIPEIRRVSYAEHAEQAVAGHRDPDLAGAIAREATRIDPLQRIQVAFDQLARQAEDQRKGVLWDASLPWPVHVRDTLEHARRYRDILACAARAADSMIEQMSSQLSVLEEAMSAGNPNEAPRLTNTGEPHPLEQGGYDPQADPQKEANISDVEALKEGKTTRAQAEAIGRAAEDEAKDREPTPAEPPPASAAPMPVPKAGPQVPASEISPPKDEPPKGKGKR